MHKSPGETVGAFSLQQLCAGCFSFFDQLYQVWHLLLPRMTAGQEVSVQLSVDMATWRCGKKALRH